MASLFLAAGLAITTAAAAAAAEALGVPALGASNRPDFDRFPPNISYFGHAVLFDAWRPKAHLLPTSGQMVDPCMHYYDRQTGLLHLNWLQPTRPAASGVTTRDLVTFTDIRPDSGPIINHGGRYDRRAVFDGSVIAEGIDGKPTLIYSGVRTLPISWKLPYPVDAETQLLATSSDGGRTFVKLDRPPIARPPNWLGEPSAFRDPYVFQDAELDGVAGSATGSWYFTVSGGIKRTGPGQFLYRQRRPGDFGDWDFLGLWMHEPPNSTFAPEAAPFDVTWGYNMETVNVMRLDGAGYNAQEGEMVHVFGAEWRNSLGNVRDQLWMAGKISSSTNTTTGRRLPRFTPYMVNRLDWGYAAYAGAGKLLPADSTISRASGAPDRFIITVWLSGNRMNEAPVAPRAQNWTGALLFPRELRMGYIPRVVDNGLARQEGAWLIDRVDRQTGLLTLRTLHFPIARETLAAITDPARTIAITQRGQRLTVGAGLPTILRPFARSPASRHYILRANISFPSAARKSASLRAGFHILTHPDGMESTSLYYRFSDESIVLERANSSAIRLSTGLWTGGAESRREQGRLRLFDTARGIETLNLTVVVDGGIVEIHANDRFALSAWVKPWFSASNQISFFAHNNSTVASIDVTYSDVLINEGLVDAFPGRKKTRPG